MAKRGKSNTMRERERAALELVERGMFVEKAARATALPEARLRKVLKQLNKLHEGGGVGRLVKLYSDPFAGEYIATNPREVQLLEEPPAGSGEKGAPQVTLGGTQLTDKKLTAGEMDALVRRRSEELAARAGLSQYDEVAVGDLVNSGEMPLFHEHMAPAGSTKNSRAGRLAETRRHEEGVRLGLEAPTPEEARVKELVDEGMTEEQAWTELANKNEVPWLVLSCPKKEGGA